MLQIRICLPTYMLISGLQSSWQFFHFLAWGKEFGRICPSFSSIQLCMLQLSAKLYLLQTPASPSAGSSRAARYGSKSSEIRKPAGVTNCFKAQIQHYHEEEGLLFPGISQDHATGTTASEKLHTKWHKHMGIQEMLWATPVRPISKSKPRNGCFTCICIGLQHLYETQSG